MLDIAPGEHRLELPFDLSAPHVTREWLGAVLDGLPSETHADLLLLASETVTNAVRHGHGPAVITVRVAGDRQALTILVHDCGPGLPPKNAPPPPPTVNGGRGLLIVSMLSAQWGVELDATPPGKTVWFRIDLPAQSDTEGSTEHARTG